MPTASRGTSIWQMLGERSEADTFQCLAWLYDGFRLADGAAGQPMRLPA